ncbi:endoglycoceramidase [Mycobacteroides abscessus subsp. bolletii]|uniref:glycoside hydrolase family 5 protein n=1 Tax=Mycobacteroides abscessus TaxID=36809 RepID=UPI00092A38DF|nr:cellulase family glycosylhydrolase [Mycobacteroides abscessus]SIJ05955.1 endoglycoceramidase [Mycobacteroides abscessus subsp. bolletii]SLD78572.1 endoglycoceramidase [Mycobacteroides abscessus subsp. bolletii]SLD85845.1 endoglycoceramidase [Mycobacteroides abscessus subsp. bolletii]
MKNANYVGTKRLVQALGCVLAVVAATLPLFGAQGAGLWLAKAEEGGGGFASSATFPFGHAGTWITDAKGRVVVLHGENVVNKNAPYYPSALGFDDRNAELLAREGFNAVRLGFFWSAVEPQPGMFDDQYVDTFRNTVAMLYRHGIVTLVEAHSDIWGARFGGDGAPEWATLDDGESNPADLHGQIYMNMMGNRAVKAAFSNFFANAPGPNGVGLIDAYTQMWKHVAARLRGTQGLVGYGIINQPSPGRPVVDCLADHCPQDAFDKLNRLNNQVGAAIRSVDGQTSVQVASYFPGSYGAALGLTPPAFANAQYGLNSYCIAGVLLSVSFPACTSQYEAAYSQTSSYIDGAGIPAVINEFGSTTNIETITGVADLADQHALSWFHWSYHGRDTTNFSNDVTGQSIVIDPARPLTGDNVNSALLYALARPYPWLTSGVPQGWSFDPTARSFRYTYSTTRAAGGSWPGGAVTEISVPPRAYPNGYRVNVSGGRALNSQGPVLKIAADPGAAQVSIEINDAE